MEMEKTIHGETYVIEKTCDHDDGLFYTFLVEDKISVLKEVACIQCKTVFKFKKKRVFHKHFRNSKFIITKQCDCEIDDLIYQFHSLAADPFLIKVLCYQCKTECKFEKIPS